MSHRKPGLFLTVLAILFLGLDGGLLLLAGVLTGRLGLILWGLVFLAGAVLVIPFYRRFLRQLDDIARARREMRFEVELLRRSVGDLPPRDTE